MESFHRPNDEQIVKVVFTRGSRMLVDAYAVNACHRKAEIPAPMAFPAEEQSLRSVGSTVFCCGLLEGEARRQDASARQRITPHPNARVRVEVRMLPMFCVVLVGRLDGLRALISQYQTRRPCSDDGLPYDRLLRAFTPRS